MPLHDTYAFTRSATAAALLFALGATHAAPVVQQSAGKFDHKATVTITGSGFGNKTTAAPVIWDDASGGRLLDKWSGYWPDSSSNSNYDMAYRAPIRGIGLPHQNVTRYIAGAHGENGGASAGYNVMLYKSRTITPYPAYTYASWYQRSDDNWTFGCGSPGDDNYKAFDYSMGSQPYTMPENWYLEYNPRPTSRGSTPEWHILDDGYSLTSPDTNGHSWWWEPAVNPMSGVWSKIEVEIKYTNQSDGYIKLWENGVLKINYKGITDRYPGTTRSEAIGGYTRCRHSNNWRYFADVYLDYSRSRVVLANNADYAKASVLETQVPTEWTASSITASVNLGKFKPGDQAWLFVFDTSGQRNATGYPVTIGGSGDNAPPSAPTGLQVTATPVTG